MKIFLISHVADIDGLMPVILSEIAFNDFNYELLEVSEVDSFVREKLDDGFFDEYDKVFMTDLCVGDELAEYIDTNDFKNKFMVLDHHYTNLHLNSYDFIKVVVEENGVMECGTSLFYKYLIENYPSGNIKKNSVAYMVSLVRLDDTWEWKKYGIEEGRYLTILLGYYGVDYFINNYVDFLRVNNEFYFTKTENILIEVADKKIKDYIEDKKQNVIFKEIDGYSVGIVFAELYRSELGNAIAEFYQDKIDFAIIINVGRSVSYRAVKEEINVGDFATIYGGKGHKHASGSPIPDNLKDMIIECIYGR